MAVMNIYPGIGQNVEVIKCVKECNPYFCTMRFRKNKIHHAAYLKCLSLQSKKHELWT